MAFTILIMIIFPAVGTRKIMSSTFYELIYVKFKVPLLVHVNFVRKGGDLMFQKLRSLLFLVLCSCLTTYINLDAVEN